MSFIPKFRIYDATGTLFIYEFPLIYSANHPHSAASYVEHTNVRSKGSIIVPCGEEPWDLILGGILRAKNYVLLTEKLDEMESAIPLYTPFIIKIPKKDPLEMSGEEENYEYKVKRIQRIFWDETSLRTNHIHYQIIFRVYG